MSELFILESGRRRKAVESICSNCNNSFLVRKSWAETQKYCSAVCRTDASRNRISVSCGHCGKVFEVRESKSSTKTGYHFCCREHKDLAQKVGGILTPVSVNSGINSYRETAFSAKKVECENCGYNKHKEVLDVHHIDHDRTNNVINNLKILCPTCHIEEHFLLKTGRYKGK